MGRDLEPLAARFARDIVIDADQVILHLREHRAVALVRAGRHLGLLGATHPADGIVVRPVTSGTLKPRRPLFRLLVEELSFVHEAACYQVENAEVAEAAKTIQTKSSPRSREFSCKGFACSACSA